MKVITIATDLENTFLNRLLIPSCRAVGLDLTILHAARRSFEFAEKRAILAGRLAEVVSGPDELVVFTDAYDTLFIRGPEQIERTYAGFGRRVVFGAELNSWPLGVIGFALYDGPPVGRYPYLNSGGFMGPARDLLDLCNKYPQPPSHRFELLRRLRAHGYDPDERFGFSDQYYWALVHLLEPELIALDHEGDLFEYYGPPIPDVNLPEIMGEFDAFRTHGRESASYQKERKRLGARLQEPSRAAQVHFASHITKAVMLDLLAEGALPAWIMTACQVQPMPGAAVDVHRI